MLKSKILSDAEIRETLEAATKERGRPVNILFTCARGEVCSPTMSLTFQEHLRRRGFEKFFTSSSTGVYEERRESLGLKPADLLAHKFSGYDFVLPLAIGEPVSMWVSQHEAALAQMPPESRPTLIPYLISDPDRGDIVDLIGEQYQEPYLQEIVRVLRQRLIKS
ncbi:Uncharacterised protein [uncultured archaeon]|nr:Uncharacterised protein [uncultured archaeon]